MPSKSITDAFVRNLKLPRKDREQKQVTFIDTMERGLALVLVASYGGTRTFRVMTYVNSKARSRKLGTYPGMTVKEARSKAREYWQNPQKYDAQAEVGSFKEIAQEWFTRYVQKNQLRSQREIQRILDKYVYPKWQTKPFLEIRRIDVNRLLDEIEDNHGTSQADAVLAVIRQIMGWFQSRHEHYLSPIVRGMKRDRRKPKERARNRFLSDDEIRLVWGAAAKCGTFGSLVKVTLLTAQRREKAASMRWQDIQHGVWTVPAENREKGTAGRIKLPKMALEIIDAQPQIADNPYVFSGRGKKAFNHFSQGKDELFGLLPKRMPNWRLHDLRRTARKLMTRASVRPDVAELALGHSIKGIQAVYDDPAEYRPMIDHALQCVANEVEKIVNPRNNNVVAMTDHRRTQEFQN